jgi:putative endonuclease
MQGNRKILGQQGETAAISFLEKKRYIILETNYRTRTAEIDIIARKSDDNCICFIEVKTRRNYKKGLPKESVTPVKQKKIITGALVYLKKKKLINSKVRFDVIEVLKKDNRYKVNLIKHAFQSN